MADMMITTGTKTRTEEVLDVDIGFLSGDTRQFTLFPQDTYEVRENHITIRTIDPSEMVIIYTAAIAWMSERHRTIEIEETTVERES